LRADAAWGYLKASGTMAERPPTTEVRCSFCRKHQDEVRKIVAGPSVYICDECIDLCNDIIAEECDPEASAASREPLTSISTCIVCRLPKLATDLLLVPGAGFVCRPCADAVRSIADAELPPPSEVDVHITNHGPEVATKDPVQQPCRLCGLVLPALAIPDRGTLCEACVNAVIAVARQTSSRMKRCAT